MFKPAIDDAHLVTQVGIGEECDCTLEVTKRLGLEDSGGMVRVGPVHYNTVEEIRRFGEALGRIASSMR